jgi:hypothetical protein
MDSDMDSDMDAHIFNVNRGDWYGIARLCVIEKVKKFVEKYCGSYWEIDYDLCVARDPTPYLFKQLNNSYSYKALCDQLLEDACINAELNYKESKHIRKKAYNKIANWYLECKYNPKYKKCREKLDAEYNNLALCD